MRQLFREQLSLAGPVVDHPHAQELRDVDRILTGNPEAVGLVPQDLQLGVRVPADGREGMSADQVLRAAVLKQLNTLTYEALSFHLADSSTYRAFCGIGVLEKAPSPKTLQRNIKRIREETWEAINRVLLGYAADQGVEKGRKVRVDATVIESLVHPPTDSSLLWDSVRVLTRLLRRAAEAGGTRFPNRARRAKRRSLAIANAKDRRRRRAAYRDLLKVTRETVVYAEAAAGEMDRLAALEARALGARIRRYVGLAGRVIDQTERRVLHGESVPAGEKVVSRSSSRIPT